MKNRTLSNTKLGVFVLAGILFLVLTLYMIGRNRNLLGATFLIKARVNNVNGLVPGNNVRFKGIDVGTVKEITIADDTSIFVIMTIDKKMKKHIKQNAIASIGTDGLMGNKLININSQSGDSAPVEAGSILPSRKPIETDEMLRTLNTTNNSIAVITKNLQEITGKLNNSNSLWNLLADTVITYDLRIAIKDFRHAGSSTAEFTSNANDLVVRLGQGKGLANALFTDTVLTRKLDMSLANIEVASQQTTQMIADLNKVVTGLRQGEGTAGLLLSDTASMNNLNQAILNIEQGTSRFNENMEALKHNFLFRGYFKKQEKAKRKEGSLP